MKGTEKLSKAVTNDIRWAQVVARAADAEFFYSVRTTGVYCRPSCAARLAHRENVQFHLTCSDAEQAGFRPCKRCKPNQVSLREQNARKIAKICRRIERSAKTPDLQQLAADAGMSVFHFHRTFKAVTGLTPHQYAAAHRKNRVRATLERSNTVTNAIYDAGFNSTGRL